MSMEELRDYLETLCAELAPQPARLEEAYRRIPESSRLEPIQAGGWSPHKILVHTVAAQEHALQPRLVRILNEDKPDLPNWDQDSWMDQHYDSAIPTAELFSRMKQGCEQILERVADLELEDWNRTGRHPMRGSRTLLWWFEYLVAHNKEHIQELERAGL